MVLADSVILVEGPSDDLIIQRAYHDKYECLPIENGVDVISVLGLSFKRFLDIAMMIGTKTTVVTDNDGDPDAVHEKYREYTDKQDIHICYSRNAKLETLEPQLVDCNDLNTLNGALNRSSPDTDSVLKYMNANKTEAAFRIFEAKINLTMPEYITEAISG